MKTILISIPAFNEAENIKPLYHTLKDALINLSSNYEFEYLFINDGSTDKTVQEVSYLMDHYDDVTLLNLSRNYGKEIAMAAGFDYSTHDAVITIDADLQHPPNLIPKMISLWETGYDDIYAKRKERKGESFLKKATSKLFYKVLERISATKVTPDAGDYRLLDRKVVAALMSMRESERYTKGLYNWVGFKKVAIEFDAEPRLHGKSKWSFNALLKLAVEGITSYTTAPLKLSMYFGFFVSFSAFVYMIYVLIKTLIYGSDTSGFPTIIIIVLFLGGCQLISIGIIGEYLSSVFIESKRRPLYFKEDIKTSKKK
ncbi:glycosyltransferase family 2 protein [Lapidilactobacillus bayanensis]|uniref:glycosyltransferase family 2 protein n=1 Tax=Lapidilactobacillus bayanensis TaxID=2485998 RepID=UPI000F7990FC|nr:glycosyltransferase family 2 protein [Lapidilactobacillus bayanensis]